VRHSTKPWIPCILIAAAALFLSLGTANAADKKVKDAAKPAPAATAAPSDYNTALKPLKFREIGPAVMGGRIDDFAVVENNPDIIYAGSASGGIFKTVNGGTTWEPVFDDQSVSTIGDVTVAPSDPSIVWVGTGEANNRQSSSWGDGVYKSSDAGKTWQHLGLTETRHIGRIVVHPSDPNTVYVAALGNLWGPSKDRGVYKTTDGGRTWSNVLFVNEDTGITDIAMDPFSPGTLIAAAYQRRRTVFGYNGSGPGSGLYKTTDGGATWKKLEKGLPWDTTPKTTTTPAGGGAFGGGGGGGEAPAAPAAATAPAEPPDKEALNETGRIGVNFYRRDSNIVYALIEHAAGGIFRSEDKGETWTKMSDTDPRGSYYSQVHVDPNNDQRIWVHGANMFISEDGGKTFRQNQGQRIHGDFHAMWIDPHDSNHMITGSDGGIYMSRDRGKTWDFVNTIPLGQFYEIGLDMARPYHMCGGLQDNNVWCGPSATFDTRGIANSDWFTVGGGDGFYAQIDPTDPNLVYTESQDGNVLRRDLRTHESRSIRPPAPEGEHYRFQWSSPIVISSYDPKTIYYGGNYLFVSHDRGDGWTALGPDLTTGQDRSKLPIMGKAIDKYTMSRNDGVEHWPCITTVSESPVNKDLLWAGTDDGNVQVTRDGGKSWKNVAEKVKGVPKGTYVSRVLASRYAEGTAYATFDGHRSNDFGIYVYMTTDFGESWKPIKNGLPDDTGIVHVIREHYRNPKLLFVGTERGLFVSPDQGGRWTRLGLNLPTVPVDDIAIHPRENDLVLATHGRSIWILDDMTPVEQWSDAVAAEDLHLFDLRAATEWRVANRGGNTGQKVFFGPNPPNGALIYYYLKNKPDEKERVRITISDKDGKVVREMDGTKDVGVNRVVWNLRTRSLTAPRPGGGRGAGARGAGAATGETPVAPAAGAAPGAAAATGTAAATAEASSEPAEPSEQGEQGAGGGGGFGGNMNLGLRVEPGEYTIKVVAGKSEQSKKVTVEEDPRIQLSAADRAARRKALDQLAPMVTNATTAQRSMTGMRTALNTYVESWKKPNATKPPEAVQKATQDLLKKTDETCRKLATPAQCGERAAALGFAGPPLVYTPPPTTQRITQLTNSIENFAAAPTAWQLEQIKLLQGMLTQDAAAAKKLSQEDLPALNKLMNDAGVQHIVIPPTRGGGGGGGGGGDDEEDLP
jgi:photosystem II stability/assembly factor-like uncharacterized protein